MDPAKEIILPTDVRAGFREVKCSRKAAVCGSLWIRLNNHLPIEKIRTRADGRPPQYHFNVSGGSEKWKVTEDGVQKPLRRHSVLKACGGGENSEKLDKLIKDLPEETRQKLLDVLPLAYAEFAYQAIVNYQTLVKMVREKKTSIQARTDQGGMAKFPRDKPYLGRRWGVR